MRVIAKKTINAYRECYPEADGPLKAWVALIEARNFDHFMDLREIFNSASSIEDDCIVFNIKGNHYRLVTRISYIWQVIYIKWFGRHKDYDKINPMEVKHEYPPC